MIVNITRPVAPIWELACCDHARKARYNLAKGPGEEIDILNDGFELNEEIKSTEDAGTY